MFMDFSMSLYISHEQKINSSVVASFPVFMMNMFGRFKRSADYLLYLVSVLVNVLSIAVYEVVAVFKDCHFFIK